MARRDDPSQFYFDFIAPACKRERESPPLSSPPRKYLVYLPTFKWRTFIPTLLTFALYLLRLLPESRGNTLIFAAGLALAAISFVPLMMAAEMIFPWVKTRRVGFQTAGRFTAYTCQGLLIGICILAAYGCFAWGLRVAQPEFAMTYEATKDAVSEAVEDYWWRKGTTVIPAL